MGTQWQASVSTKLTERVRESTNGRTDGQTERKTHVQFS